MSSEKLQELIPQASKDGRINQKIFCKFYLIHRSFILPSLTGWEAVDATLFVISNLMIQTEASERLFIPYRYSCHQLPADSVGETTLFPA